MERADRRRNRERILAAAAAELTADPSASLERMFELSGLARTTCFRHFPNRETLLAALAERALATVREVLAAARPEEPPFAAAFARLTAAALEVGAAEWGVLRLVSDEQMTASPETSGIEKAMAALMELGQQEQILRRDLPVPWLVEWHLSLLGAAVRDRQQGQATADLIIEIFLNGAHR